MRTRMIVGLMALAGLIPARADAQLMIDWNTGISPNNAYWSHSEVGWYYTPTESFWVSFLGTRFAGYGADRDIYAEIRTAPGASGFTLTSGVFNSSNARAGVGGAFFSGFLLEAGTTYFLGFRNVAMLGVNATTNSSAAGPNTVHLGMAGDGSYGYAYTGAYRPILALDGTPYVAEEEEEEVITPQVGTTVGGLEDTTVTPEPISMILLGTGLAGVGAVRSRRRRQNLQG